MNQIDDKDMALQQAARATAAEPVVSALRGGIANAGNFYRTCKNCAYEPSLCQRRATIVAGIRGLGLTGVKFRCDQRKPVFHTGQRVGVTWHVFPPDWHYEEGVSAEEWPATIVQETKRGFLIAVDDVLSDHDTPAREYIKNDSLYCNVTARRLRALDEPDRRSCEHCRSVENADGTVTGCWGGGDGVVMVDNCLAQAIEARRAATLGAVHESAVRQDAPNPQDGGNNEGTH